MRLKYLTFIVAAAFGSVAAGPAQATLVDVVWTGRTAFDANDPGGVFGAPGLIGNLTYSATIRFDTAVGFSNPFGNPNSENLRGGTFNFGGSTPVVSASVTIRGIMVAIGGDYYGDYSRLVSPGFSLLSTEAIGNARFAGTQNPAALDQVFQRARRSDGLIYSSSLASPFSYAFGPGDVADGFFQYRLPDGGFGAAGALIPETVTIATVAAGVPEPATWAMMLIGFAWLGLIARRKEAAAA